MKKSSIARVTSRFNNFDFHDDALVSVRICPPSTNTAVARIDFELLDDSSRAKKVLSFRSCANVRFIMDFDVIADNWFAQTQGTTSQTDMKRPQKFVRAQMGHWHVKYMAPSPRNKPIRKKLSSIRKLRTLQT